MIKRTPGPWKCTVQLETPIRDGTEHLGGEGASDAAYFLDFPEGEFHSDLDEVEGNAKLIANAPELLKAAKAVVARWESGDLALAVRDLSWAINKAEGEGE